MCTVNMLCVDQCRHNISVASLPTNGRVNMIINTSSRSYSLLHIYKYVPLLQHNFTFLSFGGPYMVDNNRFSIMKSKHLLMTFSLYVKIIFGPLLIIRVALCASVQDNVLISSGWCLIMTVLFLDRGVNVNEKSNNFHKALFVESAY